MKLFKGLLILALLTGMTMQASASEGETLKSEITSILGKIIPKRPPISEDGPGGKGGN